MFSENLPKQKDSTARAQSQAKRRKKRGKSLLFAPFYGNFTKFRAGRTRRPARLPAVLHFPIRRGSPQSEAKPRARGVVLKSRKILSSARKNFRERKNYPEKVKTTLLTFSHCAVSVTEMGEFARFFKGVPFNIAQRGKNPPQSRIAANGGCSLRSRKILSSARKNFREETFINSVSPPSPRSRRRRR